MLQYKKHGIPGSPLVPVKYQFLEPVQVRVKHKNGAIVLTGYGIGEIVEALEPATQNLLPLHEKLDSIPLADGSQIIEYPENMKTTRVWNQCSTRIL